MVLRYAKSEEAFYGFNAYLERLINRFNAKRILEIGAGVTSFAYVVLSKKE